MMKQRTKLLYAGVAVLLAVAMLVGTSLAWLTISTQPVVSSFGLTVKGGQTLILSEDGDDWTRYLDKSSAFTDYAPLKPVSTYDGVNWFLATYKGEELETDLYKYAVDSTLANANVKAVDDNGNPLTGAALVNAYNQGYYVYTDFWVKTQSENGCKVRLSTPSHLMQEDLDAGYYGTYVLPGYAYDVKTDAIYDTSLNSTTSLRVGFLIFGDEDDPSKPSDFIIYEPNATNRSNTKTDDLYVVGNTRTKDDYEKLAGTYVETKPMRLYAEEVDDENEKGYKKCSYKDDLGQTVVDGDGNPRYIYKKSDAGDYVRYVDGVEETFILPPGYTTEVVKKTVEVRSIESLDPSKLIVQQPSTWNLSAVKDVLKAKNTLSSLQTNTIGMFYDTAELYASLDANGCYKPAVSETTYYANENLIYTFTEPEKPIKIRMFVWVEGQDIDCWNDIAGGTFIINVELAGED